MKLTAKLYRVTTIRTDELIAACGKDPKLGNWTEQLEALVNVKYRPLAPRFQIWTSGTKTVVGMEVMAFDVQDANIPMAGLVMADPMIPQDVDRVDGALESELNRMNISTNFDHFEWRFGYEIKGN